jgi:hypothetical protein
LLHGALEHLIFNQLRRNPEAMPTPEEVLGACHSAGRMGTFSISEQAHARARGEGHSSADLRHALAQASSCELTEARWMVRGPSLDGTEVTFGIVLANGALSVV